MTHGTLAGKAAGTALDSTVAAALVVAVVVGGGLAWATRIGAAELLVAVAVAQALLAGTWVLGLRPPGRVGALVISAAVAAVADTAVSAWPHSGLGTLLVVLGLAVPVMFVHQLARGAARVRIVESLGWVSLLMLGEVSLPALVQLDHAVTKGHRGADVVLGVLAVAIGALVAGLLLDVAVPVARFEPDVPRGLPAVAASAAAGAVLGRLALGSATGFPGARGILAGAVLGTLVALLAVVIAFIEHDASIVDTALGRWVRPVLGVLFPLSVLAPVAFVVCLAIRT